MTAVEFITGMYCAAITNGEEIRPMTAEDAAYNLKCYADVDGIIAPPTVTPLLFARVWNILLTRDEGRT